MANFALDIKKFADSFEDGAEAAIRGTTIKLWSAIIHMTPVDEGRAIGSWFATGQQPSTKVNGPIDKDGKATAKRAEQVVMGLKDYSTFTLTNNLPYIEKLEFGGYGDGPLTTGGYSNKAPAGMLRVSINRFNKLLEAEAKKALPK